MEKDVISPKELEQLVEQVAGELKKRMESRTILKSKQDLKSKKKLLVIGTLTAEETRTLMASYDLTEDLQSKEYESLMVSSLSFETMAYVAHGISGNPEAACILQGLLNGRQIFLLEQGLEYQRYKECAGKMMYRICQKQEDMLKNMGILILHSVMDAFDFTGETPVSTFEKAMDYGKFHLLQESDVIRARGMGYQVIKIGKYTKITPLAMDYIMNHSLTIHRQ